MREEDGSELHKFTDLLSRIGADFQLVQAFGGNASVKNGSKMLVKASGKRLAAVSDKDYFYEVSVSNGRYSDQIPNQSGRPSIETFLHATLPEKYVVHLHSTFGVALSAMAEKDFALQEQLRDAGVEIVEYFRPGDALNLEIQRLHSNKGSSTFLLQNHGTLFCSNSVSSLENMVMKFEELARRLISKDLNPLVRPDFPDSRIGIRHRWNAIWHAFSNWRFTPDHCVFLGPRPTLSELRVLALARTSRELFALGGGEQSEITPEAEQLGYFFNLSQCLPHQKFSTLSYGEAVFLAGWELEKYRRVLPN